MQMFERVILPAVIKCCTFHANMTANLQHRNITLF